MKTIKTIILTVVVAVAALASVSAEKVKGYHVDFGKQTVEYGVFDLDTLSRGSIFTEGKQKVVNSKGEVVKVKEGTFQVYRRDGKLCKDFYEGKTSKELMLDRVRGCIDFSVICYGNMRRKSGKEVADHWFIVSGQKEQLAKWIEVYNFFALTK